MESLLIIAGILCTLFYFLPALIAFSPRRENRFGIALVNLFFGWPFLGWIAALIWATSSDKIASSTGKS